MSFNRRDTNKNLCLLATVLQVISKINIADYAKVFHPP
jgi:hypothetical protein